MNKGSTVICGNVNLVYSQRIICYDDAKTDIWIKLTDNKDDVLKLQFVFEFTNDNKKKINIAPDKDGTIIIKLFNYNETIGTGLKKPLLIAKLDNRSVFLLFNISKTEGANPIIDVSIYLEKA